MSKNNQNLSIGNGGQTVNNSSALLYNFSNNDDKDVCYTQGSLIVGKTYKNSPNYAVDISGVLNATGLYVNNSPVDLSGVVYASSLILNNTSLVPSWSNPNITDGSIFYNNGAVGINKTSPAYHLDVEGTGNFGGDVYCGQYMGIGTTSPAQLLHINGTQPNILVSASGQSTDNKNWTLGASGTHLYGAILNDGYTSDKIWLDVQRTGMNITKVAVDSPLVGIGKTNPTFPLDVSGNMNVSGSTYLKSIIQDTTTDNTYIGRDVMFSNTTGYLNVGIGMNALAFNSVGNNNTSIGGASLANTLSSNNTAVGFQSGYFNQSAGFNTFLGSGADVDGNGLWTNSTAIGANCKISASNQIMVGTASQKTVMMGNVSIGKTTNAFPLDISGSVNFTGTLYQNGSAYTQTMPTDISCNNLTVATNMFYGANRFRYVPWTSIPTNPLSVVPANVMNMINSTDGTSTSTSLPTFNSTPKYYYSVIGNTMYLSYAYKNSSGGTAGNGVYGYIIPSGFTLNSTLIIPSVAGSYNNPQYTQVGTGVAWIPGVWSSYGNPIYVLQNTSVASGFSLGMLISLNSQIHSHLNANYSGGVNYSFQCSIPIN